jgi:hypothetical protein
MPAATVAPRLTSSSRPYGARVLVVVFVVGVVSVVVIGISSGLAHRLSVRHTPRSNGHTA